MASEPLVGPVRVGWELTTLGEACLRSGGDIQTGPFGSQLHASDYVMDGIPSIMPQNIGDNRVVETGIARISPEDALRLARYRVRVGDIVYSRRGDVEKRALIRRPEDGWLCGTGCLRVRFGDGTVIPEYASYYLGDPRVREWVVRHAHGATMPNLNTEILSGLPFLVPPLPEQRAIVRILGPLDDKIELNRRMNGTLEAMAQALFTSWFIDFSPVRAKTEGRDPGLPTHLADMFPDSFEDSELGEIPGGWRVGPLGSIADVAIGGDWGQDLPGPDDITVRCLRGVDLDALRRTGWSDAPRRHISRVSLEKRRPQAVDVLVEGSGECGRSLAFSDALTTVYPEPVIYSNFCKRLTTPSAATSVFVQYLLNGLVETGEMKAFVTGTAMPNLDHKGLLAGLTLVVPPDPVLNAFAAFADSIRRRLFSAESRTLAALRDTLLPKLVSGEIRVPQVERILEAAPG
jgi:type I restriction enzyme S subunit